MNTLRALARRAVGQIEAHPDAAESPATTEGLLDATARRFVRYRGLLRGASVVAGIGLAVWMIRFGNGTSYLF